MALERLTNEELKVKCREIFYDFMSSDKEEFFDENKSVPCTKGYPTPMDMLYKELQDSLAENKARIDMFHEAIEENKTDKEVVDVLTEQLEPLLMEKKHFEESCMSYMKELYKETGVVDYSRNLVRIPLDKKINSFYDDLVLEVLFYDDVAVAKGKYEEYKALTTQEERKQFIKDNTEITHLAFVLLSRQNQSQIGLVGIEGKLDFDNERVRQNNIILLDYKYSDFNSLTLSDTMKIQNNDIRQLFQTKIDLDKENMKVLADLDIRGDNYKLLESNVDDDDYDSRNRKQLFIRYICPSTGRVYYNPINKRFLEYSEYYNEKKYDSYLEAWWSVCHIGANPRVGEFSRC